MHSGRAMSANPNLKISPSGKHQNETPIKGSNVTPNQKTIDYSKHSKMNNVQSEKNLRPLTAPSQN